MSQINTSWIPEERRIAIRKKLRDSGVIHAADVAKGFGVSTETIRRDFLRLEKRGELQRLYGGGARAIESRAMEASFAERQATNQVQKLAMAKLAGGLIEPDETVIFDVGTSVSEVASHLPITFHGRVLTHSLRAAIELDERSAQGFELFMAGGRLRAGDMALSGGLTDAFYRDFFADRAFLGSGCVDPERGLTDYHVDEASTRRIIINSARETYVLADSSKLGDVSVAKVCDIGAVTAVITDGGIKDEIRQAFERADVQLLIADTADTADEALPRVNTVTG